MKRSGVLLLVAGLALAGCGSGAKRTVHYTTSPSTAVDTVGTTSSGHRGPLFRVVPWPEAQRLLKSCRVRNLEQLHSRVITLTMLDGGTATTHEPSIDDIFKLLARLPPNCQPKTVATE